MVLVDVKQHLKKKNCVIRAISRTRELCESQGGRPGLPLSNSPYGLYGCKPTLKSRTRELCESQSFFRPTSDRVIVISTNAVAFLC